MLNQLNLCGINEKFIYPGMDGIGRYINQAFLGDGALRFNQAVSKCEPVARSLWVFRFAVGWDIFSSLLFRAMMG